MTIARPQDRQVYIPVLSVVLPSIATNNSETRRVYIIFHRILLAFFARRETLWQSPRWFGRNRFAFNKAAGVAKGGGGWADENLAWYGLRDDRDIACSTSVTLYSRKNDLSTSQYSHRFIA